MDVKDRRLFFDMERNVYCEKELRTDVSLEGSAQWEESLFFTYMPQMDVTLEVGRINASPMSAMMATVSAFNIEVNVEGRYQNFEISPSEDPEMRFMDVRDLSAFMVSGYVNGEPALVVLDTGASEIDHSINSVNLAGISFEMGSPSMNSVHGLELSESQSGPIRTFILNPSMLRGVKLHFDSNNSRVGIKKI